MSILDYLKKYKKRIFQVSGGVAAIWGASQLIQIALASTAVGIQIYRIEPLQTEIEQQDSQIGQLETVVQELQEQNQDLRIQLYGPPEHDPTEFPLGINPSNYLKQ
jgi:hypothetical protein